MAKYDALQSDFSAGELSPRAQGHVDSDSYKSAVGRAANVMPTRTGSLASRAGGKWVTDGFNGTALTLDNSPVQHITVPDGPFGDFTIEISRFGLRLMDRYGVQDLSRYQVGDMFDFSFHNAFTWADEKSGSVYLNNNLLQQITKGAPNGLISNTGGFPVGTNGHWTFSGRIAGSDVTVNVGQVGFPFQVFNISAAPDGTFTLDFVPLSDFNLQLQAANAVIWDLKLQKNATKTAFSLVPLFGISPPLPGVDRIRAAAFWISADKPYKGNPATFWVAFAGGTNNEWAGWALSWTTTTSGQGQWVLGALPTDAASLKLIQGSNSVAAYQDRLWFGNNNAAGRSQLIGSQLGFVKAFDAELNGGVQGTQLTRFVFKLFKYTYTVLALLDPALPAGQENLQTVHSGLGAAPDTGFVTGIRFDFPGAEVPLDVTGVTGHALLYNLIGGAPVLTVKLNGAPVKVTPCPFNFISVTLPLSNAATATTVADLGLECWARYPDGIASTLSPFSGSVYFAGSIGGGNLLQVGDVIEFSTIPTAEDPLNLTLASPTGDIAWLNVLRGLMVGTTKNEKLFPDNEPISVDPATGTAPNINSESNLGSDPRVMAVDVNDKVLFVQRGRQIIRMANISITTSGGLVAEDIGVSGEHLTKPRVRSMCYLKTPVPRVVFALDDGTGAVMTLGGKLGVGWSRFTIPACFGGIYNVASLDGADGSQLWVGTENGVTLRWGSFESDIITKTRFVAKAIPAPDARVDYDNENPLPPVMDSWVRVGVAADRSTRGLSASLIGQPLFALVNGQLYGPYVAVADGHGGAKITFPAADFPGGLGTTWVDSTGATRAQEAYVGLAYPEHRFVTLPLEGGNPAGTSQAFKTRWVQCHIRLVDSYLPVVGGFQAPERGSIDPTDALPGRLTQDVRVTQLSFKTANVLEVSQPKPLRLEVSAIFGGAQINSA